MVVARWAPGRCGRHCRRTLSCVAVALFFGCGGSQPATHNPAPGLGLVRHAGDGPSVAVWPRATGKLTRLALWIDAGSRDAQPPQVATLAGWLAAEAAGPDVHALVEPEGTELALWCPKDDLARCFD